MMAWIFQSIIERVRLDIFCGVQWPGRNPCSEMLGLELSVTPPPAYCKPECIL